MKGTIVEPIFWFIYAAGAVTCLCLLIYIVGQQGYRQAANDPQAEMAENLAERLEQGESPAALVLRVAPLVDLEKTLSPWVVIYDKRGTPLESSGQLDGAPPQPPQGVFENSGFWRFGHTWQPHEGLRFSIAMVPFQNDKISGYVVVGRSMKLAEERIIMIGLKVLIAWVFTMGALFVGSFVGWFTLCQARK